jgi:hypothetical protein
VTNGEVRYVDRASREWKYDDRRATGSTYGIDKMMKKLAVGLFLIALCAARVCSAEDSSNAEMRFKQLQSLAGSWKLTHPKSPGQTAFRISYRLISRDTALVETFGDPAGSITETIYHLDGPNLMATHYCAQGNQPRLRLQTDSTDTTLHFAFFDVTNLKHAKDSHLIDLRFTLLKDGELEREETYLSKGQKDVSTLVLEREK